LPDFRRQANVIHIIINDLLKNEVLSFTDKHCGFGLLSVDKDIAIISTTNTFLSMRFLMGFDLSLKDVRSFLPILFIAPNLPPAGRRCAKLAVD
jgi:hypothetical protein